MRVSVYHNPRCSKSRATLALLEDKGIDATVIEYLKTPPDTATLAELRDALGRPAREMVRTGQDEWKETDLDIETADDDALFRAVAAQPILLERPIVVVNAGGRTKARIGRPPENVLDLLP